MRRLLVLLAVVAAILTAAWFAVARGVDGSLRAWFVARTAEGWVAEYGSLSTTGFPRRFRTVLTDVTLADPDSGLAWTAPRFAFEAAAFQPNRITARWPAEQTVASPWERIEVLAERFDASIAFLPGTRLEVSSLEANLSGMVLRSSLGWTAGFDLSTLSATAIETEDNAYRIRFEAGNLTLPAALRRSLDPAQLLPEIVEGIVAEADLRFDAPWDRLAVEAARPQITRFDLDRFRAQWGGIDVRAAGALTVAAGGIPEGRITVKITNWRDLLRVAGNAGLFPEPLMPTIERAFEVLAGLSGPADTLDAPLTFANGIVSFGPIPLGPAPRLVIR
jgi:hypothetical protein